jgi:uncharacterized protein DUF1579
LARFARAMEVKVKKQPVVILTVLFAHLVFCTTILGQQSANLPQPGPEEKRMGYFVGKWIEEVDVKPSPLAPGHKGTIKETCDWFPGGFHVVCHGDFSGTVGETKDLSIFSYSRQEKVYLYYEIIGDGDTVAARGTIQGDTWTWLSESKVGGKVIKERFIYEQVSADTATMKSEVQGDDGRWNLRTEVNARRVK